MRPERFDAPGQKVKLDEISAEPPGSIHKADAKERFEKLNEELFALQDLINAFEETLTAANTLVLKYFLHITQDEQEKRLLAREEDPNDAWKLNVEDWKDRERWDEYTEAYEEAISRCASKRAPWMVVPA